MLDFQERLLAKQWEKADESLYRLARDRQAILPAIGKIDPGEMGALTRTKILQSLIRQGVEVGPLPLSVQVFGKDLDRWNDMACRQFPSWELFACARWCAETDGIELCHFYRPSSTAKEPDPERAGTDESAGRYAEFPMSPAWMEAEVFWADDFHPRLEGMSHIQVVLLSYPGEGSFSTSESISPDWFCLDPETEHAIAHLSGKPEYLLEAALLEAT